MTPEKEFRALAVGSSAVAALVGDRVVQNSVSEETTLPYVIFRTSTTPIRGLGGAKLGEETTLEVEAWAATALQANAVADAIEAAVEASPRFSVLERSTGSDDERGLDASILTIERF